MMGVLGFVIMFIYVLYYYILLKAMLGFYSVTLHDTMSMLE